MDDIVSYIFTNSNMDGNGVFIGDKFLTVAHVVVHSNNFDAKGGEYLTSSALCYRYTNSWLKKLLCRLSFFRCGWNYDDFAIFESKSSFSSLTLSTELPSVGDNLDTYSIKEKFSANSKNIFSTLNEEKYAIHIDKAKVLFIRGNFIFCEMNGMLEEGRSGCPLIKDKKVYGILRGGDDKKICWFQSSVSIIKSQQLNCSPRSKC